MTTIVTRAGKGSPLTWNEVDTNFTNLNSAKYESGNNVTLGTISGSTITSSALTSGRVTFAGASGLLSDDADLTFDGTTLSTANLVYTGTLTGSTGVLNIGSGQIYKDTSGNVGIGTSSPSSILNIYNATSTQLLVQGNAATSIISNRNSTDGTGSSFTLRKARGTTASPTAVASGDRVGSIYGQVYGGTNYRNITEIGSYVNTYTSDSDISSYLTFATTPSGASNSVERMRIDSSGNVGIGTSSPASVLDVNGRITARADGSEGGQLSLLNPDNASTGLIIDVSSADVGRIWSNRNNFNLQLGQFVGTGGVITFSTAASERMRIDSSGNVGIGTSSPTQKLEVYQPSGTNSYINTVSGAVQAYYGASTGGFGNVGALGTIGAYPQIFFTNATERMRIDSSGNVLVNSNTLYQYQPAPTSKSTTATLTGAELITGILNTTGTSYTVTLPTGTNIDAAVSSSLGVNGCFDWFVINTASGTITIGANGNTTLGTLTIATGVSAQFRFRKTAANTYTVYRMG